MEDFRGQSFGRYRLIEPLNTNGMASVYKAQDTHLECDVAVRILHTENLPQSELEPALKLFESGAKTIAHLAHENIVRLLDYGEYQSHPYLVMEYLPGGTLKSLLAERGVIPWQTTVQLLIPITKALASLHSAGVIHGELRPERILFTRAGTPMLAFFANTGLSTDTAAKGLAGILASLALPEYLAPEYITSSNVDGHVDIYSLGIVFYEMITGHTPFQADTPLAVLFKHATEPLPAPSQTVTDLPIAVEQIIFKALEKKPEARFSTMADFTQALSQELIVPNPPIPNLEATDPGLPELGISLIAEVPPTAPKPEIPPEPIPTPSLSLPESDQADFAREVISQTETAAVVDPHSALVEKEPPSGSIQLPVEAPEISGLNELPQTPSIAPVLSPTPVIQAEIPATNRNKCPKCGNVLHPNHRFCTKCGEKIY